MAPQKKKQQRATTSRWTSPTALLIAGAIVIAIGIIGVVTFSSATSTTSSSGGSAPSAAVLAAVTHSDATVEAAVGAGGQQGDLVRIGNQNAPKTEGGKSLIVYVGAEFCPYCAAERWSLIMALSRFGNFSNLQTTTSSSTDAYPNTNTFTFHGASYSSQYLSFQSAELSDRNEQPLESPSAQVSNIFQTFGQPPYAASSQGFPFLYIGGQYSLYQTSYSPSLLQGMSWDQIASQLSQPNSDVAKAVVGNANFITAAICATTGNQPSQTCSTPTIQGLETQLKGQQPVSG